MSMDACELDAYLADCRQLTISELRAIIPKSERYRLVLYDLMLEYPLRAAKALRPALCIATCRALGGRLESVLRSAAVLELYHNAFLIHDDVEDGSESRRDRPTLHWSHGMPIAVNVGDAMLALALQPLLDNMQVIGLGKALRILQIVARMARESAEGQALELEWIRRRSWTQTDADYIRMVYKKTSWYTFIAPVLIGAIIAGVDPEHLHPLRKFAALLGIAFQIQDDVLNLVGEGGAYGKEVAGDLWEAKHTLILLHMMRTVSADEREQAERLLAKPRPAPPHQATAANLVVRIRAVADELTAERALTAAGRAAIHAALDGCAAGEPVKSVDDVHYLLHLIERAGSIEYARGVAHRFAEKAATILARVDHMAPSVHHDFLGALVEFVVQRNH